VCADLSARPQSTAANPALTRRSATKTVSVCTWTFAARASKQRPSKPASLPASAAAIASRSSSAANSAALPVPLRLSASPRRAAATAAAHSHRPAFACNAVRASAHCASSYTPELVSAVVSAVQEKIEPTRRCSAHTGYDAYWCRMLLTFQQHASGCSCSSAALRSTSYAGSRQDTRLAQCSGADALAGCKLQQIVALGAVQS